MTEERLRHSSRGRTDLKCMVTEETYGGHVFNQSNQMEIRLITVHQKVDLGL